MKLFQIRMIGRLFFLSILCISGQYVTAQLPGIISVKGRIVELTDSAAIVTPLKFANISSIHPNDSIVETTTISDANGLFVLKGVSVGQHIIKVTYLGYEVLEKTIVIHAGMSDLALGDLILHRSMNLMDNIIIRSSMMLINGDTTEFNASYFKTLPNASTEDLLKKMPGLEIERDGTIKNQGEQVTRVLVDGKPFFGNDPKMATRNLPAEIIEKVQVIDAKSEESQFTGFDDGNRIRTVNIITKKNRKKGFFGKVSISSGDQDRNAHALSITRLNGDRKISFITQYNNINNQNFSAMDFLGSLNPSDKTTASSGSNVYTGNANGISTTFSAGLNYNDQINKKTRVAASLMYSDIDVANNRDRYRETFVANDSSFLNTAKIISSNRNKNTRSNIEVEHMIDSANTFLFKYELNDQKSDYYSENISKTTKGFLVDFSQTKATSFSDNLGNNFNGSLLYRHRFHKKGRSFSVTFSNGGNQSTRSGDSYTFNDRYLRGKDTILQRSATEIKGYRWGLYLSYTEPLNLKTQLMFSYSLNKGSNTSDQSTFKFNNTSGLYDLAVAGLTNMFGNGNETNRVGVNLQSQMNRYFSYGGGVSFQQVGMQSNNLTLQSVVDKKFINFLPNFNLQYRKGRSNNIRFNFRSYTQQPNISQLQDVVNNSSVMYVRTGNPQLKQEHFNNMIFTFNKVNTVRGDNFYITLNATNISNRIANAVTMNSTNYNLLVEGFPLLPGAQFIQPINMDGAYDVSMSISYTKSIKKKRSNVTISSSLRNFKDVNMYNNVKGYLIRNNIGGNIKANINLGDRFDVILSSNTSLSNTRYTSSFMKDVKYFNERLSFEPVYASKNGWIVSNDFDYIINRGNSDAFRQDIPLWNAGFAKLFSKNKSCEIRLTIFDLMKANKNIVRNVEVNYVEDVRANVLNRYFLLSFTYQLRKFGK